MRRVPVQDVLMAVLVTAFTFTACGGDGGGGTDPDIPVATTINITPVSLTFTGVCEGQVINAIVLDQSGNPLNTPVIWTSANPSIVTVSVGGTVAAVAPGTTSIQAASGSITASIPVTVGSGGGGTPTGPFKIELIFTNCGTPSQTAAFVSAANQWMSIIAGDETDIGFAMDSIQCPAGVWRHPGLVDDLKIYVSIEVIDGPANVVGSAGPCSIRSANSTTIVGQMRFDEVDLAPIEMAGLLERVILHEMGHVLGIGTLWSFGSRQLIVDPSLPSNAGADTHFPGALVVAAFDAAGGVDYMGGAKVPVENNAEPGSSDGHWRESVLVDELMTPIINNGVFNPLSAISVQSLVSIGYTVDVAAADPYNRVFTAAGLAVGAEIAGIRLKGDVYRGPLTVIDSNGNVQGVIQR